MNNPKPSKASAKIPGALLLAAMVAAPAFAQVDFSGEWAPLYHEDGPERLPGPELADYTELPINDAARLRGGQLGRRPHLRGGAVPVPAARRRLFHARPGQPASLERDRSGHPASHRAAYAHARLGQRAHHLHGRPRAPAGLRDAHLAGVFDRRVGGQHAHDHHHASEGKLHPPQRRSPQ